MPSDEERRTGFVSVVVADSTRIHTQLLEDAMRSDSGLHVVASAPRSADLLAAVTRVPVDVAVISYSLEDQPGLGLEVLREMRALRPGIKGIVLLDSSRPQELLECFRSGAKGIFSRHDGLESLRKCIRCVHEGQVWLRGIELDLILEALARSPMVSAIDHRGLDLLSSREREVIQHLASGKTNREIADSLGLSPHTVKNYLFRMFDKVGVSSRTELLYLTMNHAPHGAEEDPDSAEADALAALVKAAEAGTPLAQLQLAEHYCGAHGSVPDLVSAYMWFLAGQQSAGAVQNELQAGKNKLSEVMSPEQLAEAERRAGEWLMEAKKRPEFATAVTAALMGIRKKSASAT